MVVSDFSGDLTRRERGRGLLGNWSSYQGIDFLRRPVFLRLRLPSPRDLVNSHVLGFLDGLLLPPRPSTTPPPPLPLHKCQSGGRRTTTYLHLITNCLTKLYKLSFREMFQSLQPLKENRAPVSKLIE